MQMQGFVDNYRFLARYNRWFNERLYAACEQLPPEERRRDRGAFFGSIQATLAHLVWADKTWLARFAAQGVAFPSLPEALLRLPAGTAYGKGLHEHWDELKAEREKLDVAIEGWTAEMSTHFPLPTMRYANTQGVRREHPMWQALTHFFNHQAHHRGQATTLLVQAGVDPGLTDLIALAQK